jgi:hypothetical protein
MEVHFIGSQYVASPSVLTSFKKIVLHLAHRSNFKRDTAYTRLVVRSKSFFFKCAHSSVASQRDSYSKNMNLCLQLSLPSIPCTDR